MNTRECVLAFYPRLLELRVPFLSRRPPEHERPRG